MPRIPGRPIAVTPIWSDLARDFRHALRTLCASPSFAFPAAATVALGVGASTAIFSAIYGMLLAPLPFPDQGQLVAIYQNNLTKGVPREPVAPGNFVDWQARGGAGVTLGAAEPSGLTYAAPGGAVLLPDFNVTRDFFRTLGVRPLLGRLFEDTDFEPHRSLSLVLTYGSWQRRFGADRGVIGRSLIVRGSVATIIGVLPRDFSFLETQRGELFAPKVLDSAERQVRGPGWYAAVGRLPPRVTLAQASADFNRVARQLAAEYPATNGESGVTLVPLREVIIGATGRSLLLLFDAAGIVLIIACINVGGLVAADAGRREGEFAIRTALGARPRRLVRQILAECLVLSAGGGAVGVLLANAGVGAIRALAPASLPRADEIRLNAAVLAFALVVTVTTAIAVGLAPALRAARTAPLGNLGLGDRSIGRVGRRAARGLFVGVELALTVALLAGAGLLTRSFQAVVRRNWGYQADHVVGATLFVWRSTPSDAARVDFVRRLVGRVSQAPGVAAAGVASNLPLMESIGLDYAPFGIVGQPVTPGAEPTVHVTSLTPGAFATLGARLQAGRWFSPQDDSGAPRVAVINESVARHYWPGEDPVGRRIRLGYYGAPVDRAVVGVVADMPTTALDDGPQPSIYLPYDQAVTGSFAVVARTTNEPIALVPVLRRIVGELAPGLPVAEVHTLDALVAGSLRPRRFVLSIFGCFSLAAFALMLVGVYGAVNRATVERTRELAIRLAMGANPRALVRLIVVQGITPAVVGLAVGLAGFVALTRTLHSLLYGVTADDPVTLAGVAALVIVAATAACYVPARRAARADPVRSLRSG